MSLSKERIGYLLQKYTSNEATEAEEGELFAWMNEKESREPIERHIRKLVDEYKHDETLPKVEWEKWL